MRKVLKGSNLHERRGVRIIVGFALVMLLAAFGCSTNRTHADGEPYIGGPGVGPAAPTSSHYGTSVPTTPQPMTSSYRGSEQSEFTAPRPHRLTADEAALIMAEHLPKVRVLGPLDPGPAMRPYVSEGIVTGQVAIATPTPVTVNTTINSPATPAITSGADFSGASAAPTFTGNLATVTPTNAALPVTTGVFAGGGLATGVTTTGTTTTGTTTTGTTTGTTTTTPTITATTTGTGTTTVTSPSTVRPTTTTAPVTVRGLNANVTTNGNVQVLSTNGRLTVTNVSSGSRQR
ncbi:MAG: hypothetical protein DMF56_24400 [Acidobacteria bacterium]|nr:MAG: hypothetical protein DMF56_24400 [Acidobacteriota bacterium]